MFYCFRNQGLGTCRPCKFTSSPSLWLMILSISFTALLLWHHNFASNVSTNWSLIFFHVSVVSMICNFYLIFVPKLKRIWWSDLHCSRFDSHLVSNSWACYQVPQAQLQSILPVQVWGRLMNLWLMTSPISSFSTWSTSLWKANDIR